MEKTQLIQLSANDLIAIIKEKPVKKGDIVISSKTSFLSVIKLLNDEIEQHLGHVKSVAS